MVAYACVLGIGVALAVVALLIGHFTDFYSVDGDAKYLAALNLARHFPNAAISYPYAAHDPLGRFTLPLTAWYGGHDYAGYSLPFEMISGLAVAALGSAGLVLPPVVATVLLLVVQLQLASLLGLRSQRALIALFTVATTPVLFYAVSFWEHTWGVALFTGGLAALVAAASDESRPRWLSAGAGLLLAGGVFMRRETIIPAGIALLMVPLLFRNRHAVVTAAAAFGALAAPLVVVMLLHPQPLTVGLTHASPGRAAVGVTAGVSKLHKLQWLLAGGYATGIFALFTGLLLAARRFRPRWMPVIFATGGIFSSIAFIFELLTHYTFADENPLAFCPLALWGIWSVFFVKKDAPARDLQILLWIIATAGAGAIALIAYDDGGAQWGPRYLLFAFPLLILLAFRARQTILDGAHGGVMRRVIGYGFVGVVSLSVFLQGLSLLGLEVKQNLAATAITRVEALHPGVVVSAVPVIDVFAPYYYSGLYLYAPAPGALNHLMGTLRSEGYHRVVMLCDPVDPCSWNGYPGWRHERVHSVHHIVRYALFTTHT
ncbi:MAG TPA: DUF4386 family protein [Chloroflexota bacterium]|jgi:hypothetical protein|nr:DUF4386 family protein [Chloroflexota bacterium]